MGKIIAYGTECHLWMDGVRYTLLAQTINLVNLIPDSSRETDAHIPVLEDTMVLEV